MNRIVLVFTFLIAISASCSKKKNNQTFLPHVTGGMNDVVVVMSSKNWKSAPGDSLIKVLQQSVPAIPQDEKIFDLVWMPHDAFTHVVKKQRNIVISQIGPDYQSKITYRKSLWSKSQIVIQIMAPNQDEFIRIITDKGQEIVNRIQQAELDRLMASYKESQESGVRKKLEEEHQIKLSVPKGYTINKEEKNFIWLDYSYKNVIEGILVYYYPYTDTNNFSTEQLIQKRDEVQKKYVVGKVEGSYPITETRFPTLSYEYKLNNKNYTYELRGLWKLVNGLPMGGPFISISQYDEERKRIVTIDGFIFAPGEDKRNLLKRLEAILYSLEFADAKK